MKHRITKRAIPAALFLGAALSFPAAARADAPDPAHAATAQALYDAATADMESGRYVAASRKLEEVMKSNNHRWFNGEMDEKEKAERKKRMEEFQERYK